MATPSITEKQIVAALEVFDREGADAQAFIVLVKSALIQLARKGDRLEMAVRFLSGKLKEAGIIGPAAAQPGAETSDPVAVAGNGTRVGADGQPMSHSQQSVEEQMDAAIRAGGDQPAPAQHSRPGKPQGAGAGGKPLPPKGGVRVQNPADIEAAAAAAAAGALAPRIGADGTPITDPTQLAAEAAMDAALEG